MSSTMDYYTAEEKKELQLQKWQPMNTKNVMLKEEASCRKLLTEWLHLCKVHKHAKLSVLFRESNKW